MDETFPPPEKLGPDACGYCGLEYLSATEVEVARAWGNPVFPRHASPKDCLSSIRRTASYQQSVIDRMEKELRELREPGNPYTSRQEKKRRWFA